MSDRASAWARFRSFPVWAQILIWVVAWPVPTAFYAAFRPADTRRRWWAITAVAALLWVGAAGASSSGSKRAEQAGKTTNSTATTQTSAATGPTETTSPPTTAATETTVTAVGTSTGGPAGTGPTATTSPPTTTTAKPATTTTTKPAPAGDPTAVLSGLRVASEGARTGYNRDLFGDWIDADGDSCDTREEVLIAESRSPAQVDPYGCKVIAGDWYSLYDGLTFADPSELDIDHMVPLAEAWDSGAFGWDAARRRAFANDIEHPQALRAVSAASNRSKSDLDPGQWKPTRDASWCEYANDWVTVKKAWDLSSDQNEIDDLKVMLRTCIGSSPTTVTTVPPSTITTTPPVSAGTVTVTALDCQGESATVGNGGSSPADLTGWSLHDAGTKHTYHFPAGYTLAPAASVTVRSGGPAGAGELWWTNSPVWNNDGDTAHLANGGGSVVSTKTC